MRKVITVDGPSGVGKGTLCQNVARERGWAYLDSGALYRLVALQALAAGTIDARSYTHPTLPQKRAPPGSGDCAAADTHDEL